MLSDPRQSSSLHVRLSSWRRCLRLLLLPRLKQLAPAGR